MFDLSWMAWTMPTAIFFAVIALLLATFTIMQIRWPSIERVGVLGIPTTRGDRLFVSLLGSAFIHLAWLGLVDAELWWALGLSLAFAIVVFRWV